MCLHECTCAVARGVLIEERSGVKINNEKLKCQRKRVKRKNGDGVGERTGGVCVRVFHREYRNERTIHSDYCRN